ncbi:uncharacterized protein [Macrobrachium rosenbergii]|uniref:uncharacterized protein isoform X1 n=1 Tax=Macrobrachium rosenbergii TaxID=79674 RepID=UPI0034D7B872
MASTGNEQQLRFRWNDHMQHISKVLTLQRFEEQFCDVTLVSDDGFVMKAHQAILASTSAYFQRVFSDITPEQHPMVVLRGANFREMSCLLDYMYQGSTQVHQSLMEAVLEVADMLEVKGLSQIRSNNSIKKFMAPPSSNSTSGSTTTPSHSHPGDNNSVGHSRSSDEQSGPHTPEEQVYRDSQSRSSELETSWMRFSGNNMAETRSKESSRSHSEGSATPSEEPPPSSHVRLLPCQEANSQETQEESQVSGMDLSMAKNEPWSPRESSPNGEKNSPSRKRRKLLEGICSEETSEPATDPDWGRVGSKVDERGLCQPRTISFTSITAEPECSPQQSRNPPSKNKEGMSSSQPLVEKTLEVPCEDGPLTISLTTGQDLNGWRNIVKRKPLFSLPLRRARRKAKIRRSLDENRKKWLAKERRSLFGSDSGGRPVTRALERLKSKAASAEAQSLEKLHVNCDPPFPTEEDAAKSNRDKENILSPKPTPDENKKLPSTHKSTTDNGKESHTWEVNDKRTDADKFQESSEELKFPAINPLSLFTLPPVKEREKQTRTTLTLEEKVKVIDAFLDGKSQRQIAHLYGIGKTQVSGIIKRREEILTIYRDSLLRGEKLTMKRQRKSEYALLNQHLIQWYRHMTVVAGVKITTGMLRAKALQIAPELGYHDFKASNGWLATFKANNNLKFSKQRKNESYDDQGNYEHDSNHRDDDESFFEDAEADNSSSHLPLIKQYQGTGNITGVPTSHDGTDSDLTGNKSSQNEDSSSANQTDQTGSLIHPGLSGAGASKAPQMVNTSLGANLTAAYNLSRDLTRDLSRGDTASVGDLSSTTMNASPLNHPVSALNVSRAVIENPLSKPSDAALATYKSEEPLGYGYDHQNRMNDASTRGAEYNYTPYGFPGSYYSYHFLGQY